MGTVDLMRALGSCDGDSFRADHNLASLRFSPCGTWLAAACRELRVWRMADQVLVCSEPHPGFYASYEWAPGGGALLVCDGAQILRVGIEENRGEVVYTAEEGLKGVACARAQPWVAIGGEDLVPKVVDVDSAEVVCALPKHRATIYDVAFSPDDARLATASGKIARVYSLAEAKPKPLPLRGSKAALVEVAFAPDGRSVAGLDSGGHVLVWDAWTGALLWEMDRGIPLRFSPDSACIFGRQWIGGKLVLVAFDLRSGEVLTHLPLTHSPRQMDISPDGDTVAIVYAEHTEIELWSLADKRVTNLRPGHRGEVTMVTPVPGTRDLMSSSAEQLCRWATQTGELVRSLDTTTYQGVAWVDFTSDGRQMACAEGLGVTLRDPQTFEALSSRWSHQTDNAVCVGWLPDGETLMVLCPYGYKTLPRAFFLSAEGAALRTLRAHERLSHALVRVGPVRDGTICALGPSGAIFFDVATLDIVRSVAYPPELSWLAMRRDASGVLLCDEDRRLLSVDVSTGAVKARFDAQPVSTACHLRDEGLVLVSFTDGSWATLSEDALSLCEEIDAGLTSPRALFPVHGRGLLATADKEGGLELWDLSSLEARRRSAPGPNLDAHLSDLRALVYQAPERGAWEAICQGLDEVEPDGLEVAMGYLEGHLEHWPPQLRVAAPSWGATLMAGLPEPRMALARELHIEDAHDGGVEALLGAPHLGGLQRLWLGGRGLSNVGALALSKATGLPGLRALALRETSIRVKGARALAKAPFMGQVVSLSLRHCPIRSAGAAALVSSPALGGLESLTLYDCGLDEDFCAALLAADHLSGLKALDLSRNGLSFRVIAAAGHLGGLRALSLRGRSAEATDLRALSAAAHLSGLERLDLWGANLTDEGVFALAEAPFIGRLEVLRLTHRGLSFRAIAQLRRSATSLDARSMRRLDLALEQRE